MSAEIVTVVGAGLAGSEAAWLIAGRGVGVRLFEMRPVRPTAVHRTSDFAELVCSNSLKSMERATPHGLLKDEMTALGSKIVVVISLVMLWVPAIRKNEGTLALACIMLFASLWIDKGFGLIIGSFFPK